MTDKPELSDDIKEVTRDIFASLLHRLLLRNLISVEELNDSEKVQQVIEANRDILKEDTWIYLVHDKFIRYAKEAFEKKDNEVGVVLLATAIEQIVNSTYREMLQIKGLFSDNEITEIIRNNNIAPKLTWLLTLVSDYEYELDDDFKNKVLKLMEVRNQIIHYKAIPRTTSEIDNDSSQFEKTINSINADEVINIPDELLDFLDDVLEYMVESNIPEYNTAKEAIERIMQEGASK